MPHVALRVATRAAVCAAACAALTVAAACHRAPPSSGAPDDAPNPTYSVGDTTFGVRLLRVSRFNTTATFTLAQRASVAIIAVRPGTMIEPIRVSERPVKAGRYVWNVALPLAPAASQLRQQPPVDEIALRRCVDARMRAYEESLKPRVVRDTSGRVVRTDPGPGPSESVSDAERRFEAECRDRLTLRAETRRAAPWDLGEGYLLVLAFPPAPITRSELYSRIRGVAVTVDNVPATMAAIGYGILADRAPVWSGSYAAW